MSAGYCTQNPTTGRVVRSYPLVQEAVVDSAIDRPSRAFDLWRVSSFARRADALVAVGSLLESRSTELSALMAREMGQPVAEGGAEAEKCAVAWGSEPASEPWATPEFNGWFEISNPEASS